MFQGRRPIVISLSARSHQISKRTSNSIINNHIIRSYQFFFKYSRVVTGVKLNKSSGIIHWSIEERILLPDGRVANDSADWLSNLHPSSDHLEIDHPEIFTLTYENRSLILNDVSGSSDELVTGVRFVRSINGQLQLEVRFTYYDRLTGQLDTLSDSTWKANNFYEPKKIDSIAFGNVPSAYQALQSDIIRDKESQFIEFGPTSVEKDLAQHTVPFIEAMPVLPYEPAAFSAVGLYLKSQSGSGGIVAPRVIVHETGRLPLHIRASIGVYGIV